MAELVSNEFTLYRKAMEPTDRRDDVNVLASMPVGLLEMLDPVLELGLLGATRSSTRSRCSTSWTCTGRWRSRSTR